MDENFYANIKVPGKPPMKINKGADGLYNIEMMVNKNIIKKEIEILNTVIKNNK